MKRIFCLLFSVVFIQFFVLSISYAQSTETSYILNFGISHPTGFDESKYWNTGIGFGFNGFKQIADNVLIGGRFAFNFSSLNKSNVINDFRHMMENYGFYNLQYDASGSSQIIELVPSVRLLFNPEDRDKTMFFGQMGFGYYLANAEIKLQVSDGVVTFQEKVGPTDNEIGINFGGGFQFGQSNSMQFEILGLYHMIFMDNETVKFLTVSAGIVF